MCQKLNIIITIIIRTSIAQVSSHERISRRRTVNLLNIDNRNEYLKMAYPFSYGKLQEYQPLLTALQSSKNQY